MRETSTGARNARSPAPGERARPVGTITRGTTNTNRLRRVDRWIAGHPALLRAAAPLVVDLGYGASGVTALELHQRLARARPDVRVVGLEIDPERVRRAQAQLRDVRDGRTGFDPGADVSFGVGGFEIPLDGGRRPAVIRAMNVLRQYPERDVPSAWRMLRSRLQDGGLAIDGTCDEIGRVCSWVALSPEGPETFTVSLRLTELERPSIVAERLIKALIHHNVPGEPVHALLEDADRAWSTHAVLAPFGPTQRWIATVRTLQQRGWRVQAGPARWRLGELTLPWESVAPNATGEPGE